MSLQELNINLKNYFIKSGFNYIELPLLFDADIFFETSGEEIRRKMYSFTDNSGKEKCLRPDMTVPTCQNFIASNDKSSESKLCYSGPVFRSSQELSNNSIELNQSGIEIIFSEKNLNNINEMDAYILKTAEDTMCQLNIDNYKIKIGSIKLFNQFINKLELPIRWKQRLVRHFFRRKYFESLLDRLGDGVGYDNEKKHIMLKEKFNIDDVSDKGLRDLINKQNARGLGARTVEEIVDRFQLKSLNVISQKDGKKIVDLINNFLKLSCNLSEFPSLLREFTKSNNVSSFESEVREIEDFVNAVSEKSNIEKYYFDNDFGHSIEFYDGMMFEIYNPDNQSELISGGRYDKLLIDLGSKAKLSAVGFATNNNNIIELI